jgi:uncharacterized protein (TIGR03437 family)
VPLNKESIVVQSAAAPVAVVAPDSLASIFGANLASTTVQAVSQPLPLSLGGVTVTVQDSVGNSAAAGLLYVSPQQINLLVPPGLATGVATFTITGAGAAPLTALGAVRQVAPALFSLSGTGSGLAAASAIRVNAANPSLQFPLPLFDCSSSPCRALPIDVGIDTPVFLTLYATGIRHHGSSPDDVLVTINGISVPVLYAGPQLEYAGVDQINVPLLLSLRGSGMANIVVKVNQHQANTVTVDIQ